MDKNYAVTSPVHLIALSLLALIPFRAYGGDGAEIVCYLQPDIAHVSGGARISIVGSMALDQTQGEVKVYFDGLLAEPLPDLVVSPYPGCSYKIAVKAPAHVAGVVDVRLVTPFGEDVIEDGFSYLPAPEIRKLSQSTGGIHGDNYVEITAAGFIYDPVPEVFLDGQPATNVKFLNLYTLTFWTPAHDAGTVELRIVNSDGSYGSAPFEYQPMQVVEAVPEYGRVGLRNSVVLLGQGFSGRGMQVYFGGIQAQVGEYSALNDATVVNYIDVESGEAGTVDVTVIDPSGASVTIQDGYTFLGAPEFISITPPTGSAAGGSRVRILGRNFMPGTRPTVKFGERSYYLATVSDDGTYVDCVAPANVLGSVEVKLYNIAAHSTITTFEYVPLTLASVTYADGILEATGMGFQSEGMQVFFDGQPGALSIEPFSSTQMQLLPPNGLSGAVDVTLQDSAGSQVTLVDAFTLPMQEGEGTTEGVLEGVAEGMSEGGSEPDGEGALEGEGDPGGEGQPDGDGQLDSEGEAEAEAPPQHSADTSRNGQIELGEVLRVIQLLNADAIHCDASTEDGFATGQGGTSCAHHASDYAPADWRISLSETLRLIQLHNAPAFAVCDSGEDGYCITLK